MEPQEGQEWRAGLPEEIRGEKSFDVIKGKDWTEAGPAMAKQFLEAQKLIGGSIRIPKEDATPEEKAAFLTKLGRPEAPEKYEFERPMLPTGAWSEDTEKRFRKLAHDIGLNNNHVKALVKFHGDEILAGIQENAGAREADVSALKKKYGSNFGGAADMAEKAVYHLAEEAEIPMEKAKAFLEMTALGDNPILFEMFRKLGESYLEGGFIRGDSGGYLGPEEARAKAEEENKKYVDERSKGAPRDPEREKMISGLFEIAYGKK